MAPSVEAPKNPELNKQLRHFTIELADDKPFDSKEFDRLAQEMFPQGKDKGIFKFLVISNTMFIFPALLKHGGAVGLLDKEGITGEVQAAGNVFVDFEFPDSNLRRRIIEGWSTTLESQYILTKEQSDRYKFEMMAPKLKDFFTVR